MSPLSVDISVSSDLVPGESLLSGAAGGHGAAPSLYSGKEAPEKGAQWPAPQRPTLTWGHKHLQFCSSLT